MKPQRGELTIHVKFAKTPKKWLIGEIPKHQNYITIKVRKDDL